MKQMKIVAGIDVAKNGLEVSAPFGKAQRFDNTAEGIAPLIEGLRRFEPMMVVCEPTGGHERLWVGWLSRAKIKARLAHPNKARAFARAAGCQAKTDKLDARLLRE